MIQFNYFGGFYSPSIYLAQSGIVEKRCKHRFKFELNEQSYQPSWIVCFSKALTNILLICNKYSFYIFQVPYSGSFFIGICACRIHKCILNSNWDWLSVFYSYSSLNCCSEARLRAFLLSFPFLFQIISISFHRKLSIDYCGMKEQKWWQF